MRSLVWAFLLLFAGGARAAGESGLSAELVLDEQSYLPGEALPLGVKITNLAGQPVTLGRSTNWLEFFVEDARGDFVRRTGEVPVQGEFSLESATAGTRRCDLTAGFDLTTPGRYEVTAQVQVPEWGLTLTTPKRSFVVANAVKLWEVRFGVPPRDGTTGPPTVRSYALQQANRRRELKLFVRVANEADGEIVKVVPLDRLLTFSQPEHQLDQRNNLHVLFQNGARSYYYGVVNPDGDLVARERHEVGGTTDRPRLARQPDGAVRVAGGVRVVAPNDVPAPAGSSESRL